MSNFVSASPIPLLLTPTQLWLGVELPDSTELCGAMVEANSSASPPTAQPAEAAPAIVGTVDPAEASITIRVADPSLRQELQKFKDLLRLAKLNNKK